MPSSATITAFYVFTGGTPASANNVNTNFSTFRGHVIPVDPNTATAGSTRTYDIGSVEYSWRNGYFKNIDMSPSSVGSHTIEGLSSGGMSFKISSTEVFRIDDNGFYGRIVSSTGITTSASYGQIATTPNISTSTITSSGHISGSTLTIQTLGRRVMVSLLPSEQSPASVKDYCRFSINAATAITSTVQSVQLSLVRNGTIIAPLTLGNPTSVSPGLDFTPGSLFFIDAPGVGTHNYSLYVSAITSNCHFQIVGPRLKAFEF